MAAATHGCSSGDGATRAWSADGGEVIAAAVVKGVAGQTAVTTQEVGQLVGVCFGVGGQGGQQLGAVRALASNGGGTDQYIQAAADIGLCAAAPGKTRPGNCQRSVGG